MNTRIALVSFFSIVSLALAGCSADSEPAPLQTPPTNSTRTPGQPGTAAPEGEQAAEGAPAGEGAAQPGEEGAPAEGKPTTPSDKQPTQADPACVASCNSGLKAKCEGDDLFCSDVCSFYTAQEISCLSAAPTCDKPEWIRCMPNDEGSK